MRIRPPSEEDPSYPYVLARSAKVRVIDCRNHMQWIIQARRGKRWRSGSFCRFRETLFRLLGNQPELLAQLGHLPEWHPDITLSMERRAAAALEAGGSRRRAAARLE